MKSNINRIGLGFLVAFVLISGGLFAYDVFFVWPVRDCEEHGHWWDDKDRICAVPVPLSTITGRRLTPPPVRAAAAKPAKAVATPAAQPAQSPTKR